MDAKAFAAAVTSAAEKDCLEDIDDACWEWLASTMREHGKEGITANKLLQIAKELVYA